MTPIETERSSLRRSGVSGVAICVLALLTLAHPVSAQQSEEDFGIWLGGFANGKLPPSLNDSRGSWRLWTDVQLRFETMRAASPGALCAGHRPYGRSRLDDLEPATRISKPSRRSASTSRHTGSGNRRRGRAASARPRCHHAHGWSRYSARAPTRAGGWEFVKVVPAAVLEIDLVRGGVRRNARQPECHRLRRYRRSGPKSFLRGSGRQAEQGILSGNRVLESAHVQVERTGQERSFARGERLLEFLSRPSSVTRRQRRPPRRSETDRPGRTL